MDSITRRLPFLGLIFICLLLDNQYVVADSEESIFDEVFHPDYDESASLFSLFSHSMGDSETQLIIDLDLYKHFFNYADDYRNAITDGDIDYVKYGMKAVEKVRELDISAGCVADVFHLAYTAVEYATHVEEHKNCTDCKCTPLFQQKKNERSWIFNVLDSMGKVPAGVTGGNNLWVGSYPTCRKVSVVKNKQGQKWNGQYCLAHLDAYYRDNPIAAFTANTAPDAHCKSNLSSIPSLSNDNRCFDLIPLINFGLCVPDTCSNYDVKKMVKFAYGLVEASVGRDLVCDVHVECKNGVKEKEIADSSLSHLCVYLLSFIVIMLIFGTSYDYLVYQRQLRESDNKKKLYTDSHAFIKMVLAFSVYTNGRAILRTDTGGKKDQIECLHGMRFLSMAWIILGHTYYYIGTSLTTDNLVPTLIHFPQQLYTQIIVQAPLAVDSFFFLSGLLSSYMVFKKLFKDKIIPSLTDYKLWLMIYVRRYLRITPTYVFIMLLDVTVFSYITNGPFWRPIEKTGCRISWWTNLIYMNNFLLQDQECCMGWTWYLANDFQLQVFSPLVLIPLSFSLPLGLSVAAILMGLSSIAQVIIMLVYDYPPAPLLTAKLQIVEKLDSYWNDVYVKPYVRCGPFITGIIVGYLLIHFTKANKSGLRYKMSKKSLAIGWTISTVLGLYSVFGLYDYARTGDISEWWRILYGMCGRPAYAVAIGWVAFVCATGNASYVNAFLGWKFFTPLSRITFDAYLIHPILLQIYNLSRPQPFHFTTFFQMLRHTFEAVIISYMAAFLISLSVEIPTSIFEERLMDKINGLFRKKRRPSVELQEIGENTQKGESAEIDETSENTKFLHADNENTNTANGN